LTSNKRCGIV